MDFSVVVECPIVTSRFDSLSVELMAVIGSARNPI